MQKGSSKPLIVGMVAGEVSGDILGAGLMSALKNTHPNIRFVGVAGPLMQQAGCEAWFEMDELAVMGISEVLSRLPRLLAIRHKLKKRFTALKPDVFIGIDAPDFNLSLEYYLKQQGIKVVHYVSPSVWAWRQKRVIKIKSSVDKLLAFLPFEKAFYDEHGVPCQFVGHTMADKIALYPNKLAERQHLGLKPDGFYIALLPGSRTTELTMLTAVFLRTAQQLQLHYPNLEFLVPLVDEKRRQYFEAIHQQVAPSLSLTIFVGQAREIMLASDFTLLASGTAALECMLVKCPMVVAYKVKPFTYWLAKKLVKTPFYSLPNLLAGEALVDELLQDDCTEQKLVIAMRKLIESSEMTDNLKRRFTELHQKICCNADEQAAKAVLELIE